MCLEEFTNDRQRHINKGETHAVLNEREGYYLIELDEYRYGWFPKRIFKIESK
jgi:uncharacterized protein YgiM (DUF1202 family)